METTHKGATPILSGKAEHNSVASEGGASLVDRLHERFVAAKKAGLYRRNPNGSKQTEDRLENEFRAKLLNEILAEDKAAGQSALMADHAANADSPSQSVRPAFRVGQKVVCVDETAHFNRVRKGDVYTVGEAYDGTPAVIINGNAMCSDRFAPIS